jgi:IS5 family transposase
MHLSYRTLLYSIPHPQWQEKYCLFARGRRRLPVGTTPLGGESPIVDATIIHAPSSTKNREQRRDPEMHQTRKGNQWYFMMKAHVGVDSKTKLIHTAVATAANVSHVEICNAL